MKKNIFIIILFLITIVLITVFLFKISKKTTKITNNNQSPKKEVEEIINNSKNITSYKCKYHLLNGKEVIEKFKNNILIVESVNENEENYIYYFDLNNNENIVINKDKKIALKNYVVSKKESILETQQQEVLRAVNNLKEDEFSINENIKYDNKNCIILEIKTVYDNEGWGFEEELGKYNGKDMTYKIWIEKETGAILKNEFKCEDNEFVMEYKYEFNCITDEEIKIPDITEYNIIEKE